ncbi:MAG: NAD(P)/FAD-dependent oxidoreductase [Bacteroidia bacterium]
MNYIETPGGTSLPDPQQSIVPHSPLKRIVVIGGGFGGIELVKRLDKNKFQVVMIDKNNYHTFQPLLYQVATGGLEPDSIAFPLRKIFSHRTNFIFRIAEALEVIKERSVLVTSLGEINYDYLVIATGSTTNYFGNAIIQNNSISLKSIPDALDLRSLILQNFEKLLTVAGPVEREKYLNIVIVGGGPTGVEIAGALAELQNHVLPKDYPELDLKQLQIHVIEASGKLLAVMSKEASEKAKEFLEKMGVRLWMGAQVKSYENDQVILEDGGTINCSAFIWTAGVKGQTIKGFKDEELVKGNRIKTDAYNKAEGSSNVFVIGDVAGVVDRDNINPYPMLAPVAMQQARNLAHNLNSGDPARWKKFSYKDRGSMATIGRNKAVADLSMIRLQGIIAWYVWMFVHLMSIVGFRNRLIVFINWAWNYFSFDRAIRIIVRPYEKKKSAVLTKK